MLDASEKLRELLLFVLFTCAKATGQDYYKGKFVRFLDGQAAAMSSTRAPLHVTSSTIFKENFSYLSSIK